MPRPVRIVRTTLVVLALVASVLGVPRVDADAAPAASPASTPGPIPTSSASPGVRDSIVRVYRAAFERAPDPDGLDYWLGLYLDGRPLASIAEQFMRSAEWQSTFGAVDDGRFLQLLYDHVLGRDPDPGGDAYWRDQLARGRTRASVLLGFSESPELVSDTGTAPPEPPPPAPWPQVPAGSGDGTRIIYGNSAQRVWMIDGRDRVVDSYLVSGRRNTPRPGTYSVFSKSERAWAGHDGITMRWMVRFAHGRSLAIGFHSIPRRSDGTPIQSESQLGTYRSAGCVRQADHKAAALYAWAPIGTQVVVLA